MSDHDEKVRAAIRTLEFLRYTYHGGEQWKPPLGPVPASDVQEGRANDPHWLPRFGLQWNGPKEFVATPMEDGYWTPWHIAQSVIAAAQSPPSSAKEGESEKVLELLRVAGFVREDKYEQALAIVRSWPAQPRKL